MKNIGVQYKKSRALNIGAWCALDIGVLCKKSHAMNIGVLCKKSHAMNIGA
jgi:hypothetical protein